MLKLQALHFGVHVCVSMYVCFVLTCLIVNVYMRDMCIVCVCAVCKHLQYTLFVHVCLCMKTVSTSLCTPEHTEYNIFAHVFAGPQVQRLIGDGACVKNSVLSANKTQ